MPIAYLPSAETWSSKLEHTGGALESYDFGAFFRDSLTRDQEETVSGNSLTVVYCMYPRSASMLSNGIFPFRTLLQLPRSRRHNPYFVCWMSMPPTGMRSDTHSSRYFGGGAECGVLTSPGVRSKAAFSIPLATQLSACGAV